MVALGLSNFLGYFVRVPPRPPYILDNLRCRAADLTKYPRKFESPRATMAYIRDVPVSVTVVLHLRTPWRRTRNLRLYADSKDT